MKRLSICIPTYNFGAFIGQTLESIVPQLSDDIEVVILDGGSTDDTEAVVRAVAARAPAVRYHRQPVRGGIDRDMARVVELAEGEYCWLFSADDVMRPGAVAAVLKRLSADCDLYLCGVTYCNFEMEPMREGSVAAITTETVFDFANREARLDYFSRASSTLGFFSYLGSLVFRRSKWDAIDLDERFVDSLFAHVARIFQMITEGVTFTFLPDSYVMARGGNDSFLDRGVVHRYAKVIDGYQDLAAEFFGADSEEARHIRRAANAEFPLWLALQLRYETEADRPEDLPELRRIVHRAYGDVSLRHRLIRALYDQTPQSGFVAARVSMRAVRAARAAISGPAGKEVRNAG